MANSFTMGEDVKDDRPLIKDLLEHHAVEIDELRTIIEKEDTYSKDLYDEIWMLRYLLSHKKVSKASDAAIKTMRYRQEKKLNELGDIRNKIIDHRNREDGRTFDIQKKYLQFSRDSTGLMYAQPDLDRGVVEIVTPSKLDMLSIVKNMSLDDVLDMYILCNEIVYQILDDVTRRTGRLTKALKILDFTDFGLSGFHWQYARRDIAARRQIETLYPQLLGKVVLVNVGSWFATMWKVMKPILPKSSVEKISFVQPGKNANDVSHFLKYVSADNLWERYGGANKDWPVTPPVHLWEK